MLLSSSDKIEPHIIKSVRRAKAALMPHMKFYCITNGITGKPQDTERCGIRLFELDELAQFKEPIYVPPEKMSHNIRKAGLQKKDMHVDGPVKPVNVRYKTLATNRHLAVSLVELETSVTKWAFMQCFLAYKASFVLGDPFFSHRVKHILGQPIMIHPKKIKTIAEIRNMDRGFEPLSSKVQKALDVRRNSQIPLMMHCAGLTFPGFLKSTSSIKVADSSIPKLQSQPFQNTTDLVEAKSGDLVIEANQLQHLPAHFVHTLNCLDLNIFSNSPQD